MIRLATAFLASALVAAATVVWIVRHGRREFPMRPDWREDDDGVQPADPYPFTQPVYATDGLGSFRRIGEFELASGNCVWRPTTTGLAGR